MSSVSPEFNPCVSCGACCACFRVAFYWGEGDDCEGGTVPTEFVEDLPPYRRVMKGTHQPEPRCVALQGEIGKSVHCSIYAQRSTTCRAFPYSWANEEHNPDCDKARARWGLPPLEPPSSHAQTLQPPAPSLLPVSSAPSLLSSDAVSSNQRLSSEGTDSRISETDCNASPYKAPHNG